MNSSPELLEKYRDRDRDRPIIVHCIAFLIQQKTVCDDNEAIEAAWDIFDYVGKPTQLPIVD